MKDEITASCNMIRSHRQTSKKYLIYKTIQIHILKVDGCNLYTKVMISHRKTTKLNSLSHALVIYNTATQKINAVFPTKNKKLRCINQHGLDMLRHTRLKDRELKNRKYLTFTTKMCKFVSLVEIISVANENELRCWSNFHDAKKTIKYIDERA